MLNNKLRKIRESKGLSQLELSAKTKISPGAISNIENNKIYAYPGWRKRISEALEVPEDKIFLDK